MRNTGDNVKDSELAWLRPGGGLRDVWMDGGALGRGTETSVGDVASTREARFSVCGCVDEARRRNEVGIGDGVAKGRRRVMSTCTDS